MYDEEEGEEGPKSSFVTYLSEGDKLFDNGEYRKALESYSTALEIQPEDKTCLVARAKCYLALGDSDAALRDAEAALKDDKEYIKGLLMKAEALYSKGDFEHSLVFYHRGHKLRPEVDEFRLGIQKAQEAINNSVGAPSSVKLENKGDTSFLSKQEDNKKAARRPAYQKPQKQTTQKSNKQKPKPKENQKTIKQLLGELYADKEYLEKLLKDEDLIKGSSQTGMAIYELVTDGIQYLDTRTEFWRQQKPMYARKRDKVVARQGFQRQKKPRVREAAADPANYILKNLEEIDQALAEGHAEESLKQAEKTLKTVDSWSEDDVPNKPDVVGNLHSCIGNALLELGKMGDALQHHQKDMDMAEKHNLEDARSRALDNLGRVYARMGKFEKAIENWERKLPMAKTPLEKTWLYHEIGRCNLELNENDKAHDYGERSFAEAQEADDEVWQLNASVLIAQAEVRQGQLEGAVQSFERSLDMAKAQGDSAAEVAIRRALDDVNNRIAKKEKDSRPSSAAKDQKTEEDDKKEPEPEPEAEANYEEDFDKEDDKEDEKEEEPVKKEAEEPKEEVPAEKEGGASPVPEFEVQEKTDE
ncbi:TTC25 [Branchiostoma lanceolatum]|uniref:Outer dynein arm-docking complex subunit 4 n=1 Tax=Branchiostoma lanceolatum TaxID=7740 RepID=A0A8J9Z848_BRALA|nr:TTC25 [Branchiostoma lanceolatum]